MDIFNVFLVVTDSAGEKEREKKKKTELFMVYLWFLKDAEVSLSLGRKKAASAEYVRSTVRLKRAS